MDNVYAVVSVFIYIILGVSFIYSLCEISDYKKEFKRKFEQYTALVERYDFLVESTGKKVAENKWKIVDVPQKGVMSATEATEAAKRGKS